jgi:predicted aminopeptidase
VSVRAPLLAVLLALSTGCETAGYLMEQGRGQLAILHARRRVRDVLDDPAVPADVKARLSLAMEARAFGVRELGLRGGDAYTRFLDTGDQPIAWSVYAAYRDRLQPYLHRFPIAGAVPYLGFFDKASAERERARLDAMGLDTFLVPVAGYSTLGFTADPIFSSMLEGPEPRIVEVVLHEMLHGTVYRPGNSEWNESLATLVGLEGARAFFESRAGGAERTAELDVEAREDRERQERFAEFLAPVIAELRALYASPFPTDEKLRRRELVFERAMEQYRARFPPRSGDEKKPKAFSRQRLNNAVLLAFTTYHDSLPALRAELAAMGGDLRAFVAGYRRQYGK